MRLDEYEKRFGFILEMDSKQSEKDRSGLMTDLERDFQVPMMKDETWERGNPEVYALYRIIADSRVF